MAGSLNDYFIRRLLLSPRVIECENQLAFGEVMARVGCPIFDSRGTLCILRHGGGMMR